jgi:hypothetical protein
VWWPSCRSGGRREAPHPSRRRPLLTVDVQYKGQTLVSDKDVQNALDDCYSQKKLFLEVDLILGGVAQAAAAPAAQVEGWGVGSRCRAF